MALSFLAKKNKEINRVLSLPLERIEANPNQPRKNFDPVGIEELSRSIVSNGLLQPIAVRATGENRYELIAGERRMLAFHMLGRTHIPAIIEDVTDEQSAAFALIENLQRKDLNFFEEAAGIAMLMEQLRLNQQQVSTKIGRAQSTVANKLRLLRYTPEMQQRMLDASLTERHARALLKITQPEMLDKTVSEVIQRGYTVEQTEQYVHTLLFREEKKPTRLFVVKDMRMFHNSINKACSLMNMAGIPVENKKIETDESIEYRILIPKSAVYKPEKKSG